MKISTLIFVLPIFGLPEIGWAEPVYLKCYTNRQAEKVAIETFTVKINETSGKITHSRKDGSAFITDGFFSADKIAYKRKSSKMRVTYHYEIDRTNLKIRELLDATVGNKHFKSERNGKCTIFEMKNRKI